MVKNRTVSKEVRGRSWTCVLKTSQKRPCCDTEMDTGEKNRKRTTKNNMAQDDGEGKKKRRSLPLRKQDE